MTLIKDTPSMIVHFAHKQKTHFPMSTCTLQYIQKHKNMHMLLIHLQTSPLLGLSSPLLVCELCHLFKCSLIVWPQGPPTTHMVYCKKLHVWSPACLLFSPIGLVFVPDFVLFSVQIRRGVPYLLEMLKRIWSNWSVTCSHKVDGYSNVPW